MHVITYLSKPIEYILLLYFGDNDVNYEFWLIMMCQCRFINCNKCISLMGDVDGQGGNTPVKAGAIW